MLALGLLTFAGCLGSGALVLRALRVRWPTPFLQVGAVLLGLHLQSLAVQILAMLQLARPALLIGTWIAVLALGAVGLALLWRDRDRRSPAAVPRLAVGLLVAAAAINLAAAVVPSSKIDELYYVNLFTSRLIADHGLVAYRLPIESAMLLQMTYAAGAAPLHALGFPDAMNVVSWSLGLTLVWSGWRLLRDEGVRDALPYIIVAAIPVGIYPLVFHVTAGSHALGDLALASAILALALAPRLIAAAGSVSYAFLMSLLCWSAASAKLSLFPISLALLAIAGLPLLHEKRLQIVAALGSAWLAFAVPIALWDWRHVGSPFGPVLSDLLGGSFFASGTLEAFAALTRQSGPLPQLLLDDGVAYAAAIWLAVAGFFLASNWPRSFRISAAVLLAGQVAIVIWMLPHHPRFLGGLPYGLAICFALRPPLWLAGHARALSAAAALAVLPWLAGQLVYGAQFVPRALGLEDRTAFLRQQIALFDDFQRLDKILPADAVLFAPDLRPPAAYAPRPIFFDVADLPAGRPAFLMTVADAAMPNAVTVGAEIYANPDARIVVFRRWWIPTAGGELRVYPVLRVTSLR